MGSTIDPIRKSIRTTAAPARAFEVFTAHMSRWWHGQGINKVPIKEIILEPRPGGRWFERGEDGSEVQWGNVIAWEPPSRLLLEWQINPAWRFDPSVHTEIEVRFVAEDGGTLVQFEHRKLEGLGLQAEEMRRRMDGGWARLLENFAKFAA